MSGSKTGAAGGDVASGPGGGNGAASGEIVDRADADRQALLTEVEQLRLALALGSSRSSEPLDEPFDRMGLGSLDLNELVARVEDRFAISLPTDVLAWVETPRDLLAAVHRAPGRRARAVTTTRPALQLVPDETGAAEGSTLPAVLEWHCARHPDRGHITLLDDDGEQADRQVSYAQLRRAATAVAVGLVERGVTPGDSVALVLPTGRSYFETFFGVLMAGAVPVPIYPPARRSQLAEHLRRQQSILENSRSVVLVTVPEARSLSRVLQAQVPTLRAVVVAQDLPVTGRLPQVDRTPNDVALLQYTSGSTGDPKGVVLTHANLLANIRALADNAAVTPDDVFVSWLPLYHDMGLIGAWLTSLTVGMRLAVMSPVTFLRRPSDWLWAIHEQGGTVSGGPNFAYARCAAKVTDAEIAGLDLSSWRLAFNGAEPVSADTLDQFAQRFEPYGFRRQALMPVYGLAESSVGLTFPPPGRGPVIDRIDRERFIESGRAVPVGPERADAEALRIVACGQPLVDHDVRIVDTAGLSVGERQQGRIVFRGPSATSGYLRNPAATDALFHGDWLDTGDLGYFADGDLFVTGRVKDVIISAGRNLHPTELEEAVGAVPDVRAGCVAVFGDRQVAGGSERIVVVAETRLRDRAARAELQERIVAACVDVVDVAPDEVVLVAPGVVPKTSSGKIRRGSARELWATDALEVSAARQRLQLARLGGRAVVARISGLGQRLRAVAWSAYAWTMCLVTAALVMVALTVVPSVRLRRRVARVLLRGFARVVGVSVAVEHRDRLPDEPSVLVANHQSMIDGLVLGISLPLDVTFVAGRDFAARRFAGFAMRRLGTELVDRAGGERGVVDTERLASLAAVGTTLLMFPEGRLEPGRRLGAFHLGAFAVAARAQVPVTPLSVHGTDAILAPRQRLVRRGVATLHVSEPIWPKGADWAAAVALRRAVRNEMLSHC